MTDEPENERAALAAEHALRILRGDELRETSALEASDSGFARDVARWRGRLRHWVKPNPTEAA